MKEHRLTAHALIEVDGEYLVTKRSKEENTLPEYWDIPGGLVDKGELPKDAVIRETKEEVNLNIEPIRIIHEDSNFDTKKDAVYVRLVYICELKDDINNIKLDLHEHSEYRFISSLEELKGELTPPFMIELFEEIK